MSTVVGKPRTQYLLDHKGHAVWRLVDGHHDPAVGRD